MLQDCLHEILRCCRKRNIDNNRSIFFDDNQWIIFINCHKKFKWDWPSESKGGTNIPSVHIFTIKSLEILSILHWSAFTGKTGNLNSEKLSGKESVDRTCFHLSLLLVETVSMKFINRTRDNGPCWTPTCTGDKSDLLQTHFD